MVCVRDSRITFIVLIMIVITWSWTVTRICVNNISRNVNGNTSILGQPANKWFQKILVKYTCSGLSILFLKLLTGY